MAKQTSNYTESLNQSISGDINAEGDIRIDGELEGNIHSKGRLVIGPKGRVVGEIFCNNIEISGYIKGKMKVLDLMTMKSSAMVYGDLTVGKLSVEPGALFSGTCVMGEAKDGHEKNISKEQKQN